MHACVHTQRHIEMKEKIIRLADLIKVDCRSEGADLGYKSRIPCRSRQ